MHRLTLSGYVLITGGGTFAPADAVRGFANDAEGDTSVAVAKQFVARGVKVVLVLSKLAWYKHRFDIPKEVVVLVYFTYADYVARIREAVSVHGQPAYAISTAAVSDYGYLERPAHKTRSDGGSLTITIPALPKVIDNWRDLFGNACRIIGFKLLTRHDDTPESLVATARRQNARARLDATIANFQEDTEQPVHSIWFVLADGRAFRVSGTDDQRAAAIAAFAVSTKVKASTTIYQRCRSTGRVLMLHRGDGGPHPNKWVPPGGGEEEGDVAMAERLGVSVQFATGIRETEEEAGIDLSGTPEPPELSQYVGFSSFTDDVTGATRCWFNTAMLVERDTEDVATPDDHETVGARWMAREDVRDVLPLVGPLTQASLRALVWTDL